MDILDTLVTNEITQITSQAQSEYVHRWVLIIKANGKEIKPLYIDNIHVDRLYHKNYADEVVINATFTVADYQFNILPYRSNLEASLTKIILVSDPTGGINNEKPRASAHYRVQLQNANSDSIGGDNPLMVNKDMSTKVGSQTVRMQLYNPALDILKKKTFGTNLRGTDPLDAIGYVLTKFCQSDGSVVTDNIRGVDIDPSFKKMQREHIPIPHNVPVVEVPHVIDRVCGGLHPAQMRYYLQSQIWFIYPIFDHQRFMVSTATLTVIKIPKTRLPSLEKTFRVTGVQVIVLSTRDTTHQDNSETKQQNLGNGVRFVDSKNITGQFYQTQGNKAVGSNKQNLTEATYEPRDGNNFLQAGVGVTDKYNHEYAKLAERSGSYIQTQWENANIDLLRPGMPVRYIFQDGDTTQELFGTLVSVESLDYRNNSIVTDQRFTTIALLTLFVSRISPVNQGQSENVTNIG